MPKPSRKFRIMHLVLSLETGGLERLVSDFAISMDKDLFDVEVCCFNNLCGFFDTLVTNGIRVTLLKRNQKHYDYLYAFKLKKLITERNIDILHMHNGTFFHGVQAGFLARTPVMVYTDHGRQLVESKIDVLMDRFSGFFVDKIVAVSKELEKYLINEIMLPEHKTTTIINGINTEVFVPRKKPLDLMKEFSIAENHIVIGTVGRLAEVKDQSTLIDAFYLVQKSIPDINLIIVGDGPLRYELESKVEKLNLKDHVKITGNRNDIPNMLNLFDVFVLSSLSEGTSVALLEAMAAGVSPVVTDVGGNPSIVDDNINGMVVKPKHVNQIAESLLTLLTDEKTRIKFGKAASGKIISKYSINHTLKQYSEIYMETLSKKGLATH